MALPKHFINRVNETLTWWNWHVDMVPKQPVDKQVKFLLTGLNNLVSLVRELSVEVSALDDGRRTREDGFQRSSAGLIIPKGVRWHE